MCLFFIPNHIYTTLILYVYREFIYRYLVLAFYQPKMYILKKASPN